MMELFLLFETFVKIFGVIGLAVFWVNNALCTWLALCLWNERRAAVAVKSKAGRVR